MAPHKLISYSWTCYSLAFLFCLGLLLASKNIRTDDAYIFYTYAKNLAQGRGYAFNPGEYINGTTSALYTILIALIYAPAQFLPLVSAPKVGHLIGIAGLFFTLVFFTKSLLKDAFPLAALFFIPLLLANGMVYAGVGMESFLLLALLSASLFYYQENRLKLCALLLGFAALTRPDAVLFGCAILVHHVWKAKRFPNPKIFLVFFAVIFPWLVFSYLYFGTLLPQTLGAKLAQTDTARWGSGFIFLKGAWDLIKACYGNYSILIVAASFVLCMYRKSSRGAIAFFIVCLWSLFYLAAYGLILNPPAYSWYYTPLAVPAALWIALALENLLSVLSTSRARRLAILVTLLLAIRPADLLWRRYQAPLTTKYALYKRAAAWLNQNAPPGSTLACNEVGVLGYYYTQGRIIDPLGLITAGALNHIKRRHFSWHLEVHKPDFLILNSPPRPILEDFAKEPWFQETYGLKTKVTLPYQRGSILIYQRIQRPA
jgi:hypothetical protein